MITSNLWTDCGLVNGATGTLRHFIFEKNANPPQLPVAIVIEMDAEYRGPHLENKTRYFDWYFENKVLVAKLVSI